MEIIRGGFELDWVRSKNNIAENLVVLASEMHNKLIS